MEENISLTTKLGDVLANRVHSLKQQIEQQAQTINDLRSIMFKAATDLRVSDPERFKDVINALELPTGHGCQGQGCAYAFRLHHQINELERRVYEYETMAYLLSSQLGVDPMDPMDHDVLDGTPDCCGRR